MRKFAYNELNEDNSSCTKTTNEYELMNRQFDPWLDRMVAHARKHPGGNADNFLRRVLKKAFLDEWMVVNAAWEVNE